MKRFARFFIELALVICAIFIADFWQSQGNIIPRNFIHLPQVDYSISDFWIVIKYFTVIHVIAFLITRLRLGDLVFSNGQRIAKELLTLVAAYSISALVVFITTTVNFDPDFVAGIGICSVTLFILAHYIAKFSSNQSRPNDLWKPLFKQFLSFSGVFVLILAMTPPVLAYFFTKDRDVANVITQIRIKANNLFTEKANYQLVNIKQGLTFDQPILAKLAPDNKQTLYVLERAGRLVSLDYPPTSSSVIKTIIDFQNNVGEVESENGALGLAFHPEFGKQSSANSGYIYIYYTAAHNDKQINKISRFNLNLQPPSTIKESETPLFILNRETSGYHNGGGLEFGPDGFLYIALGEGIHLPDEKSIAKTLRQGILRIDVDKIGGETSQPPQVQPANGQVKNYYIPTDNPFISNPNIRNEYWAIGLRNPFRIGFDKQTGDLWAGDVGSTKWEEVNRIKKGGDYQYPYIEGREKTGVGKANLPISEQVEPVYTYLHTAYDRAVIGGNVYYGRQFPELVGSYIFADNYSSKLYTLPNDSIKVDQVSQIAKADQFAQRGVSSVNILANGDVLVTTLGRSAAPTGEVLRLIKSDILNIPVTQEVERSEPLVIGKTEALKSFVTNCARCHGAKGKADGPDSEMLGVKIADFSQSSFQQRRSDEELAKIIRDGGSASNLSPMMPPWGVVLEKEEIDALIQTIRDFEEKQ